jgi:hypothetical protein
MYSVPQVLFFPDEEYTLTASRHSLKRDISLYNISFKDKFNNAKGVSLVNF